MSSSSQDSVLAKVEALLSALGRDDLRPPLGLSALARASGVSKATTHRLADELCGYGLMERTSDGYRLGARLFELGQRVPRYSGIAHVAEPFVEDLYRATGQTVHLTVRDGTDMVYVLKVRDHRGIDNPSRVAGRVPAHCTASGRALLAFEDASVLQDVLSAGLEPRTPHTIAHPTPFFEKIREARMTGTATEIEEVELGLGAVASPVFGLDGPVAAIGVVVRLTDGRPEQYRTAVRTLALSLSRVMSGRAGPA